MVRPTTSRTTREAARLKAYHRAKLRRLNGLCDKGAADIDPTDALAFVVFWRESRSEDGLSRVGRDDLANRLDISEDRASKAVKRLADMKAIRLVYAARQGLVAAYTIFSPSELDEINPTAARIVREREAAETADEAAARRDRVAAYKAGVARGKSARSRRREPVPGADALGKARVLGNLGNPGRSRSTDRLLEAGQLSRASQ